MAVGRHIEIYKNLNNSWTVSPIFTKFGMRLRLDTLQTPEVPKPPFFADEKPKFTKNWLTSKLFDLCAPNLVCIIYSAPGRRPWSQNREIHNTRWPPAAILKFTKTWITPEPSVRFSPNLVWSIALTPPRQRKCQNRHFSKSMMAATKNWHLLKIE